MFDQVCENLRKATEAGVQVQQDLLRKWVSLWPGMPATAPGRGEPVAPVRQFQRDCAEAVGDLLRRQREAFETAFRAGQQAVEKAFKLGEAKTAEELRATTIELWQKSFEGLRQVYEAPLRECQAATEKWLRLGTKVLA
jgi:hypothetical protein